MTFVAPGPQAAQSELLRVLTACRRSFGVVGLMSAFINVLMLTGSIFMLQVYDRVLASRSVPTLVGLAILAATLYLLHGILETLRGRILVRIGGLLDERMNQRIFDMVVRLPLLGRAQGDGLQPVRDLDQIRGFLSGAGPTALFDMPFVPLYLAICFVFHRWIGIAGLVGGLVLVVLTVLTERLSQSPQRRVVSLVSGRNAIIESCRRNAEALRAMGLAGRMAALWGDSSASLRVSQQSAADIVGGFAVTSKIVRMMLQSAVLGLAAYLVIQQELTAGIMIASAILVSRALAPVELAIANWRSFVAARQSWQRLTALMAQLPADNQRMALPKPCKEIAVQNLSVAPPAGRKVVVQDISFAIKAGSGLAIIGPSASGKSSLVRAVVGVWRPATGTIRLDGATLDRWSPDDLGRHIGYLPQDFELFDGTVAQNIARFDPAPDPTSIIAAACSAGIHEMVLRLPEGYESRIHESGMALSAGQRQRIGLARALYQDPFLVVLDEPNSNLDSDGENALTQAIIAVRRRGGIVLVVAHRPSALAGVDQVLMLTEGRMRAFGPRDDVIRKMLRPRITQAHPQRGTR
jgi:PrtD family type I secretion system ABC transporter